MKRAGVVVLALIVLAACQREGSPGKRGVRVTTTNIPTDERNGKVDALVKPSVPQFLQSSHLGAKLGPDGAVSGDSATFVEGEPVYLTLELHESPPGLQTHVVWMTSTRKPIRKEMRDMKGAKVVTFALTERLAPAHYRVEGYWGGNLAAEKEFDVVAPAKKKTKG